MNNKKDFGTLVKNPNSPVKSKTYTIIPRYLDSYMDAPSKYLPFFLKSNKEHTKTITIIAPKSDLRNLIKKKINQKAIYMQKIINYYKIVIASLSNAFFS